MSLGVPILALVPESETKEIIQGSGSGVVVDPQDIDKIIATIVDLMSKPDRLSEFGTNGEKFAQTALEPDNIANQYIRLFKDNISKGCFGE